LNNFIQSVLFGLDKNSNVAIITHGDLDGLASAIQVEELIRVFIEGFNGKVETIFTQPFLLDQLPIDRFNPYNKVFLTDIAINNRYPNTTLKFIQELQNKILVIDHHRGWAKYNIHKFTDFKKFIDEDAKSCCYLIKKLSNHTFSDRTEEIIRLGNLTDQGKGENRFNWALKINLRSNEAREQVYGYGISLPFGIAEWYYETSINEKAEKYQEIEKNTKAILKKCSKIKKNVMFVDMRKERDKTVDKTLLFFTAYKKAPYVVLKFLSNKNGNEYLTIATNTKKNLVKLLKVGSGARYRVTVRNDYNGKKRYTDQQLIELLNK